MNGASLAQFTLSTDLIDMHGQQIGRGRRRWSGGLHLGNDLLELGIRGLAGEPLGLADKAEVSLRASVSRSAWGQNTTNGLFGNGPSRTEVAERTDNFLAWAFGSENTLDEDVVGVSLAFVGPR